jgi:hypothetical protein
MEYGYTAHNRTVYASPPLAARAMVLLGHCATLHSHGSLRHILPALVFDMQSSLFKLVKHRKQHGHSCAIVLKISLKSYKQLYH